MNQTTHKIYFFTNEYQSDILVSNIVFLKHKEYTVLFYPSTILSNLELLKQYMKEINSSTIDYVVITSLDCVPLYFYDKLTQFGLKPIIVTDEKIAKQLRFYIPVSQLYVIQEHQFLIEISDDLLLQCYPTPFIHAAGSFMVYDTQSHALISSSLFGSCSVDHSLNDSSFDRWTSFHQTYFPGSDYLRPVLNKMEKLDITTILPQYGPKIDSKIVKPLIEKLYQLEFFNNNLLTFQITKTGREYNYQTFCNQVIRRWKDVFGLQEVLNVFSSSEITIDASKAEISSTNHKDFQLWHRLFEIAYDKKGVTWLSVVEPIVNKLNTMYQIQLPVIYQSVIVTAQQKMSALDEEKDELSKKVNQLQENLKSTLDRLGRCPITNEFNESFFKQYIKEEIEKRKMSGLSKDIVCIFIDIDQIREINVAHSKEAGDETLKNVAYLLNQLKKTDQIIFKRNGPGFIVYISDSTLVEAMKMAETFRNKIADSSAFIKNITISEAIVRLNEYDAFDQDKDNIVDDIFAKGEYRLKLASSKGGNQITNESSKDTKLTAGHILLVDTEDFVFLTLQQALRAENYDLVWVKNGDQAFNHISTKPVDFIICEKMVTKLDGFLLKQTINESNEYSKIPFMLTTYNKNKELLIRSNQLAIDYIVTKPFIVEEVIGYIKRSLQGRVKV